MQVRTRHTPAFGVARLLLAPGESVVADFDTLLATSYGLLVDPGGPRGHGQPAAFTATAEGGWVDLAPTVPGDVHVLELDGMAGWCVSRRGVLAACATVLADPHWPGLAALFGTEGGFLDHVSGTGPVVLSGCGAIELITLDGGEAITVAPGHLLAYPDHLQCRLRAAGPLLPWSARTGEGLLLDFAGPGRLLTQTRDPRTLAEGLSAVRDGR